MLKKITLLVLTVAFSKIAAQSTNNKKLRDLSPDRPHQTESPITVDKKHVMLELDLLNYTKETAAGEKFPVMGIGFFNLKVGIHKRMDLEVLSGAYKMRMTDIGPVPKNRYLDDFTFRYKYNITGNDSGKFALVIMPILTTNNFFVEKFEALNGGLLLNAEWDLLGKYGLGYTGGISSFSFDPLFKQTQLFSTVSFDFKLIGPLRQFVEGSYRYNNTGSLTHNYSFDSGFTFTPKENWQLDCGFYYFIPEQKPFIFVGGTIRI